MTDQPAGDLFDYARRLRKHAILMGLAEVGIAVLFGFGTSWSACLLLHELTTDLKMVRLGVFLVGCICAAYFLAPALCLLRRSLLPQKRFLRLLRVLSPRIETDVISAVELSEEMKKPSFGEVYSRSLAKAFVQQTGDALKEIRIENILPVERFRHRLVVVLTLCMSLLVLHVIRPMWTVYTLRDIFWAAPGMNTLVANKGRLLLKDVEISYTYPAYAGLASKTVKNTDGTVRALVGTEVNLTFRTSPAVRNAIVVIGSGEHVRARAEADGRFSVRFPVLQDTTYRVQGRDEKGTLCVEPHPHPVRAVPDADPKISITSPADNQRVSTQDTVTVRGRASDDFGLRRVVLRYEIGKKKGERVLHTFRSPQKNWRGSFDWQLSDLPWKGTHGLTFYLEAIDNDTINGPKVARSQTRHLMLYNPEEKHEKVLAQQEKLLEELLRFLNYLLVEPPRLADDGTAERMSIYNEQVQDYVDRVLNLMDAIQKMLEQDELANPSVAFAFDNMADRFQRQAQLFTTHLRVLGHAYRKRPTPPRYRTRLKELYDGMVAEVETDALFVRDILQKQRIDSVLDTAENLADAKSHLKELIENAKKGADNVALQALREQLKRIKKLLADMARQMQSMWSELPDEFLNADAMDKLKTGKVRDLMKQLEEAIQKGETDKAMKLAMQLTKMLEQMMGALQDAAATYANATFGASQQQLAHLYKEVQRLEQEEHKINKETRKIAEAARKQIESQIEQRFQEFFDKQIARAQKIQKILDEIVQNKEKNQEFKKYAEEYKQVERLLQEQTRVEIQRMRTNDPKQRENLRNIIRLLSQEIAERNARLNQKGRGRAYMSIGRTIDTVRQRAQILHEMLESWDVPESLNAARQLGAYLHYWQAIAQPQGQTPSGQNKPGTKRPTWLSQRVNEAASTNDAILRDLDEFMKSFEQQLRENLSPEGQQRLQQLAEQQRDLDKKTLQVQQLAQRLSQKSPFLNRNASGALGEARSRMSRAQMFLKTEKTQGALSQEGEAIVQLARAKQELQRAMDQMKSAMAAGRQAMRRRLRKQGGRRGRTGVATGKVALPSPDAYRVPRSFRDDILKAMRQSGPTNYRKLNKAYFKGLLK